MRSRELQRTLEAAEKALARPRYLRLRAEVVIHDRNPEPGERCPCCDSPDAMIIERRPVADLIIALRTGRRYTADMVDPDLWDDLCSISETHDIPLRCSRSQAELLLDETDRHLFASGGNRSGKTTIGLYWFALQWLKYGGPEKRFWLVAQTTELALALLRKLFLGTGGNSPGILPRNLIVRAPETTRAGDKQTVLVDGSRIALKPFDGDPGASRAKGDPIVAALVDEAAHLPDPAWLIALRGRCVDLCGRLFFASTPRPSSWVRREVVDPALEWQRLPAEDDRKRTGHHEGAAWHYKPLAMIDNCWTPLANLERDMRTLDMSKADTQRDYFGSWRASEGPCWPDFDWSETSIHRLAWEHRDMARVPPELLARAGAAGHVPITAEVVKRLTARTNPHYRPAKASNGRFIIGQDVNVNPMQSVLVQVTAPKDQKDNPEAFHFWVVDSVTSPNSNDLKHLDRMLSMEISRAVDPYGSGSTLKGCLVIMDATSISRNSTAHTYKGKPGEIAQEWGKRDMDVRAPMYRPSKTGPGHRNPDRPDSFRLVHRLLAEGRLHVFSRCGALINAFHEQIVEPDGICPVDSRRGHWDQLMGPMDALRYALYAIMNAPEKAKPITFGSPFGSEPKSTGWTFDE